MYEIQKQTSTGARIIFGIIIVAFISFILRVAFGTSDTNFNDDLIQAANKINAHVPIIIDSTTRFDGVNALSDKTFQYNYTLTTIEKTQIDTQALKDVQKEAMLKAVAKNPDLTVFKKNDVELRARYVDKNGDYVASVSLYPNEY
jgi:hypothetical protein